MNINSVSFIRSVEFQSIDHQQGGGSYFGGSVFGDGVEPPQVSAMQWGPDDRRSDNICDVRGAQTLEQQQSLLDDCDRRWAERDAAAAEKAEKAAKEEKTGIGGNSGSGAGGSGGSGKPS